MSEPTIDRSRTKWHNEDGQLHREDGPAIERASGCKCWYRNGKMHRESGPAIEYPDGLKVWYLNGKLHRLDGPAVEWVNGKKFWWIEGKEYNIMDYIDHPLVSQETNERIVTEYIFDE